MTCQHCGKTDFDNSKGCKHPIVFSSTVGDWSCAHVPFDRVRKKEQAYKIHNENIEKLRKQLED